MASADSAAGRPKVRLFVEAPLAGGAAIPLPRDRQHYLVNVMRLGAGAEVAAFNGRDGEWRARLARVGKAASLEAVEQLRPQEAGPDVWLVFAPPKHARLDYLAEKATELGAAALHPVITRRTVATRVNRERLEANAREAAEQTDRLTVPTCHEAVLLARLLAEWPAGRRLLLCDETGGGQPIHDVLSATGVDTKDGPGPWAIATGPEGGFEEAELEALRRLPGTVGVGLGPRLLRAETAALAALACWQAVLGDWRRKPRH
jgi:16S rRNA (uracil1498-N3)-methyltransferase